MTRLTEDNGTQIGPVDYYGRQAKIFSSSIAKALSIKAPENKRPLVLAEQRPLLQLVANQGLEPRTCGL
jgi:hypothetical protein